MIHQLAFDLAARLETMLFPAAVLYGPEHVVREGPESMRIMVERDADGVITASPVGHKVNPRSRAVREIGVRLTIAAQSPLAGAMLHEHQRECDAVVDAVVYSLLGWAAKGKSRITFVSGAYLRPEDFDGAEFSAAGVMYELRFRVARGVDGRNYEGVGAATGAATGVSNTTRVSLDGEDYEEVS